MNRPGEHVDAWFARRAVGLARGALVRLIDDAFDAVVQRAQVTLGDVMLAAIVDRVLFTTASRHPVLAPLRLEAGAVRFDALASGTDPSVGGDLEIALRALLTELLTVLASVTGGILTPALEAELDTVVPARSSDVAHTEHRRNHDGE